jgi:spore coat polysaccharide biosynthesis protein SpsF (cytidylyltransferase family)
MRIGAIIFSRMSSARLPGKALLPIGGRPLIGHVLDRVRRVGGLAGVALATTSLPADEGLAAFAEAEGIACWRGPRDNLVARGLECADALGWSAFARVCGDRVFLDPGEHREAVEAMRRSPRADLVTNLADGPAPPGRTVEIVRTAALERVLASTQDPRDLEHLTRHLYAHPDRFSIVRIDGPPSETHGLRFVVDTWRDLERARAVVKRLYSPAEGSSKTLSRMIREWELANPEVQPIT